MKVNKHSIEQVAKTRKEKEVWEACSILKKNSRPITYLAIGEQLIKLGYKRGSNSDIRRYLTTWKKYHTAPILKASSGQNILRTMDMHTISSVQDLSKTPTTPSRSAQEEILDLAQHYAKQFDRLLKANELLRRENNHLKKMIERIKREEIKVHSSTKPRYTLKAIFEKA